MPKAYDRRPQARGLGNALYNPQRAGIGSYNDPLSAIDDTAGVAGTRIREGIPGLIYMLTGIDVSSWEAFIESLADGTGIDLPWVITVLDILTYLFGGGFSTDAMPTPTEAVTAFADNALQPLEKFAELDIAGVVQRPVQQVADLAQGAWDTWFPGSEGGGPPDPVEKNRTVIEAVKDAVIGDWLVETKTTSGTWLKSDYAGKTKLRVLMYPGGVSGGDGGTYKGNPGGTANGGAGGAESGPLLMDLLIADLPDEVDYGVGDADQDSFFGTFATISPGAAGGTVSPDFPLPLKTEGQTGRGGRGGHVTHNESAGNGVAGTASAFAGAGLGGSGVGGVGNATGGRGDDGDSVNPAGVTKCGGAGGSGGGAAYGTGIGVTATGGDGGDGGFPAGPGGGGAGASVSLSGNVAIGGLGGLGGQGVIYFYSQ